MQPFSKEDLYHAKLNEKEINFLVKHLLQESLFEKSYAYECLKHEEHDVVEDLNEDCEFCEQKIQDSPSHFIKEIFEIREEFIQMVNSKQEEMLTKYLQEEYMDNYLLLKENVDKIVPFLGAGVSKPLGLPDWKGLILGMKEKLHTQNDKAYCEGLINSGDFLGALDTILEYSPTLNTEEKIKTYITQKIESDFNDDVDESKHNIRDIMNLASSFILTTNYDNALDVYRDKKKDGYSTPKIIEDIENLQSHYNKGKKQIVHFHGMAERSKTMVVTKSDYNDLYENQKTKDFLNGIMAGKFLLFIGFSFKDIYFNEIYGKVHNSIGGQHFIIVPNLHPRENKELSLRGLTPIGIKVPTERDKFQQGMVDAIKYIINSII
ncbi:SIR2 family protein [Bacillus wiedmannii]|nr:SIR2 family protein [Bacillus wiedmannii]